MDLEFHAQWANGNSRTAVKLSYVKQAISNKVLTLVETKAHWIYMDFWNLRLKGREFAKFLRSLQQFIRTVKDQNYFFETEHFLKFSCRFFRSIRLDSNQKK